MYHLFDRIIISQVLKILSSLSIKRITNYTNAKTIYNKIKLITKSIVDHKSNKEASHTEKVMKKYILYQIINWLCGFSIVKHKDGTYIAQGPKSIVYVLILSIVISTPSILNIVWVPKLNITPNIIANLSLLFIVNVTTVTSWISEYYYTKTKLTIAQNLHTVDEILKIDGSKPNNKTLLIFHGYLSCWILHNIIEFATDQKRLTSSHLILIDLALDLAVFQIIKDVYFNYVRLKTINEKLQSFEYSAVDFTRTSTYHKKVQRNLILKEHKIWELLNIYDILAENVQMINGGFSIPVRCV